MGNAPFGGFALVDRVRSIPLFYTKSDSGFKVSDSPYALTKSHINDPTAYSEFYSSGYCLKNRTLLENIYQIEAGTALIINNDLAREEKYFSYTTESTSKNSFEKAKNELKDILDRSMKRFVASTEGKHIAIPLSGGYDSRFLLAWLVKSGCKNITAITYGREGSAEMAMAKKVAETLGVKWIPIDYSQKSAKGIVNDGFFEDYIPFASLACSMPFFQDYTALKILKTSDLIPADSVIAPGHSGDFLAGSHLYPEHKSISNPKLVGYILNRHHCLLKIGDAEKKLIGKEIINFLEAETNALPHSKLEWWDFKERQAKFIVNSTRAYQYFGYDLRLPLFDHELIDFFRQLPFEYKLAKTLYRSVVEDEYFKPQQILFSTELQPTSFDIRFQQTKENLKVLIPWLKIFEKKSIDNNCYKEITTELYTETSIAQIVSNGSRLTNAPIVEWYLKYFDIKIGEWLLRENK